MQSYYFAKEKGTNTCLVFVWCKTETKCRSCGIVTTKGELKLSIKIPMLQRKIIYKVVIIRTDSLTVKRMVAVLLFYFLFLFLFTWNLSFINSTMFTSPNKAKKAVQLVRTLPSSLRFSALSRFEYLCDLLSRLS